MQHDRAGFFPHWTIAVLLLLFATLATAVSMNVTSGFDRAVILSLRQPSDLARPLGPDWLLESFRDITSLGSVVVVGAFAAVLGGYWLFAGNRRSGFLLIGFTAASLLLNDLLKFVFDRPRPDAILQAARVFSSGFPSGHAALSSATYLSAAILIGCRTSSDRARTYLVSCAALIVLAVGFSRIYLGLHYPTDVLAGWCVGGSLALECKLLSNKIALR